MSLPDPGFIRVAHSESDIESLLDDLFVKPRVLIRKWAEITHQTAQARLAYPGQHLASVVTGVPGTGTAARGEDLIDSSEVKSCSKADQLGQCKQCTTRIPAWMEACPSCGSTKVKRKNDSHWIISIRREQELKQLLLSRRVVLVLFDRTAEEITDIRVRVWEVWPGEARHAYFKKFVTDYYLNNYLKKRELDLDPAPCNLHPLKFDHLMMNPVKVLDAVIGAPDSAESAVRIDHLLPAEQDRASAAVEPMPIRACQGAELAALVDIVPIDDFAPCLRDGYDLDDVTAALRGRSPVRDLDMVLTGIPEQVRLHFAMRPKRIKTTPSSYQRNRADQS